MGNSARESLVIHHHGHVGQFLPESIDKGGDVFHVLTGLTIELGWLTDNDALHWLAPNVILDELHERVGRNCRQISCHNL